MLIVAAAAILLIASDARAQTSSRGGREAQVEGRVQLSSDTPGAGLQVFLFDLTDLGGAPLSTTTDASGRFSLSRGSSHEGFSSLPAEFDLGQNYPNPFNPSTVIPYQLPGPGRVRLDVFNLLGQRIATLVDEEQSAGVHSAIWDGLDDSGRGVSAGVYLYRLKGGGARKTRSMVLLDGAGAWGSGAPAPAVSDPPEMPARIYGLTVSGPGLVPYVDPGFRVSAGGTVVDIYLQAKDRAPRAKTASAGTGLLGDVDNDGVVDRTDALLVLLYSLMPSIVLPNDGDISRGDVNHDGQIDLTDSQLIEAYHVDPSDPDLPPGIGAPVGPGPGVFKLYWTDAGTDKIQRANLDGSEVEDVIDSGLVTPRGLAVDVSGGKLYWTDYGTDKIQRANLDGSGVEDLVATGLRVPLAVALDTDSGKLYWTDNGTDKIQRANLDGSDIEDVVTEVQSPLGLVLDLSGGKLYWTDSVTDKIQRSNLDGSAIEDLVTTALEIPRGLALDRAGGKLYWADNGTGKIQRANLDGSNIEDLIATGLEIPRGLALDPAGGNLYWADSGTDKVQRANLDGSDIEDVATGLQSPRGLVLVRIDPAAVENQGPALTPIPDQAAPSGDTLTISVTGSDPDNDELTYTATSGDEEVAAVEVADSLLTIRMLAVGEAVITVTVRDPGGLEATSTFTVTVEAKTPETSIGGENGGTSGSSPDLAVESPWVSDNNPGSGAAFSLGVTITNSGDGPSAATTLRYYLSVDATISTGDTQIGSVGVSALAASSSSSKAVNVTAPRTGGTYYYGACVDVVAGESDTANNCSSSMSVTMAITPPPPPPPPPTSPDLAVESPWISDNNPGSGAAFTLGVIVSNSGDGPSAATTLRYYLSVDPTISTGDTQVGTGGVSALAASGTSSKAVSVTAPRAGGTYYYGACVDAVAGESDTANNCSSSVSVTVASTPQVLVSNLGLYTQTAATVFEAGTAQGFRTGTNPAGYTLTSIELLLVVRVDGAIPTVTLRSGSAAGSTVAGFTVSSTSRPSDLGSARYYTYTPTTTVTLDMNTDYWVVASAPGILQSWAVAWIGEDANPAPGWTIRHRGSQNSTPGAGFEEYLADLANQLRINGVILSGP